MAGTLFENNLSPYISFTEHVDPSNPAAGVQRLFVDTDHILKMVDSSGTVTTFGTSLADPMTTRGDIIVRNASNVTARLPIGSNGKVLQSDGTDISWQTPSAGGTQGTELDYVQITSGVSLTATTEGTAHTCITGTSQAYSAVPTLIEVFSPRIDTAASGSVVVLLFDGGTVLGRIGLFGSTPIHQCHGAYRLTPTAATHQYIVKAYSTTTGGSFGAGTGGTGQELAAFIRITKV